MKICYTLIADGKSPHPFLTAISASLVRRLHPSAEIVLVTVPPSLSLLEMDQPVVLSIADEIITHDTPSLSNSRRIRHLKTQIPEFVSNGSR